MENRLENLRNEIDKLVMRGNPEKVRTHISHMYGVARFCTLLAVKRNLNIELAMTCGMLHDIHYMTGGSADDHAIKGAEQTTTAISRHSDKGIIHGLYDELIKDADVMDHCFYNADFPVAEWEMARYKNLLKEFGLATPNTTIPRVAPLPASEK